jgi:GNAT superfamily N-acetyltransferase
VVWTDLLARALDDSTAPESGIEAVPPAAVADWARRVESAFAEGTTAGAGFVRDTEILARLPGVTVFEARLDGAFAGGGLLAMDSEVAWLGSGAVLPGARRLGVHGRLIRARLAAARALGATWAWVGARPGSPSHRNLLGHGFASVAMRLRFVVD